MQRSRMRGFSPRVRCLRRQTPHPSATLCVASTLSHKGRGEVRAWRAPEKLPDGQIKKTCPALSIKIFRFRRRANQWFLSARLTQEEGRCATSRNARWDAVDATATTDERGFGGRRSRVVLTPRCWRQVVWSDPHGDGGNKAGRRGERAISRKPLRREGRMLSAEPVCSCACSYAHIARETAGAARTRSSLRPLCFKRVRS